MKYFFLSAAILSVLVFAIQPVEHVKSEPSIVQKPNTKELEAKVERLESMVLRLALNLKQMQIALKDAVVKYDYEDGFSILRFYQLKPFAGKLKACEFFPPTDSYNPESEGPTCRLTIERKNDGKTMVIDNFKTLPGSKETLDQLTNQDACNFPHDIWLIRYSALYD